MFVGPGDIHEGYYPTFYHGPQYVDPHPHYNQPLHPVITHQPLDHPLAHHPLSDSNPIQHHSVLNHHHTGGQPMLGHSLPQMNHHPTHPPTNGQKLNQVMLGHPALIPF